MQQDFSVLKCVRGLVVVLAGLALCNLPARSEAADCDEETAYGQFVRQTPDATTTVVWLPEAVLRQNFPASDAAALAVLEKLDRYLLFLVQSPESLPETVFQNATLKLNGVEPALRPVPDTELEAEVRMVRHFIATAQEGQRLLLFVNADQADKALAAGQNTSTLTLGDVEFSWNWPFSCLPAQPVVK
ncbi:MAG: hypothetical protein LBR88_06780 [Zoogloeaceae bacterium]|jgi:hypothetical protein|nr:hypothetical protein [Zoogloeaceae bacterium]